MYIAIDIGGTNTKIASFNSTDSVEFSSIASFSTREKYVDQLEQVVQAISNHLVEPVSGIGISIGAQVSKDGNVVFASSNLPDYVGKPIIESLSNKYDCIVRMAHDCVCGLLAEKKFGELQNFERCAYLTISTGTGGAVQLKQGNRSITFSNEMGHQIIDPNGRECLCGQKGCLETVTGGKHIEMFYGKPADQINDAAFWRTFTKTLAMGIVNLSWLTRIDAAAVSGGIVLNNDYVRSNLQLEVDQLWIGEEDQRFHVFLSNLEEHSPLIGSMVLIETDPESILH